MILYRVYPEIQDTLQGVLGDTGYFTGCIRRYRILYRVYQEIQNTLQGVLGDTGYFTGCIKNTIFTCCIPNTGLSVAIAWPLSLPHH